LGLKPKFLRPASLGYQIRCLSYLCKQTPCFVERDLCETADCRLE
jgi:hypothetical protein